MIIIVAQIVMVDNVYRSSKYHKRWSIRQCFYRHNNCHHNYSVQITLHYAYQSALLIGYKLNKKQCTRQRVRRLLAHRGWCSKVSESNFSFPV